MADHKPAMPSGDRAYAVPGREDLRCPVPRHIIRATLAHARAHPWPGNEPLTCPHHFLDTTAITEPGRKTRVLQPREKTDG